MPFDSQYSVNLNFKRDVPAIAVMGILHKYLGIINPKMKLLGQTFLLVFHALTAIYLLLYILNFLSLLR